MTRFIKIVTAAGATLAASVGTASAAPCSLWSWWGCFVRDEPSTRPTSVPEIDASAGLLTIAVVSAVLLLVWERRRRAQ